MSEGAEKRMHSLVAEMLESYEKLPIISNIDSVSRLNRETIIEIVDMIRWAIFPGYFEYRNVKSSTVEYHLGELLENIQYRLTKQVVKALQYGLQKECTAEETVDLQAQGEKIVSVFLARLPKLRCVLATDVQAAYDGDPAAYNTDEVIFSYPGLYAITVYRIAHELQMLKVPLIPRMMTEHAHNRTGIDIHPGATVGSYFFIDHGTGVVIGETTIIGCRVKIYQGVTLGALSTRGGQNLKSVKRHPTLGDEVTVYSGASILGGETVIGAGAVIGSNAFITSSVPEQTRVSIKNPELMIKDKPAVKATELGQEAFFNRLERD